MKLKKIKKIYFLLIQFLSAAMSIGYLRPIKFDNRGALVLPFGGKNYAYDEEWLEYKRLKIDESVKSINPSDLPNDFCDEACNLVDEFHKKTVNEDVEWMLYFDYTTGEVIYCWRGEENKSGGNFNTINFINRKIASIHSHSNCYSFPSPNNFDILENKFEDYEVITSFRAIWTIEFKGDVHSRVREDFQFKIGDDIYDMIDNIKVYSNICDIDDTVEKVIGDYLLNEIDNKLCDIELILSKKELV